jgi:hypothetical protein
MRKYLKDRINELHTRSKNKNIIDLYRSINEFNFIRVFYLIFINDEGFLRSL